MRVHTPTHNRAASDSEVRLARSLVRSYQRDHQVPDQQILAIAALPLPEDQTSAARGPDLRCLNRVGERNHPG